MLKLVEKLSEKKRVHAVFTRSLDAQLSTLGRQILTFRPGAIEMTLKGLGPGRMYVARGFNDEESKFWNAFGLFDPSSARQEIAVEINISTGERRTAGAFGRDADGRYYLLHNGGVGGGRVGIGQASFLAWLNPDPVDVIDDDGRVRPMILVAELASERLAQRIEKFVSSVRDFKAAQASGALNQPGFAEVASGWRAYLREFSGRKTGSIRANLDYVSYHGDVVHALKNDLERSERSGAHITNSRLIDLLIRRGDSLTDVFEVKTSTDRQSLYTALGQLLVHASGDDEARRHLVIPNGEALPPDISTALRVNGIALRRFEITAEDRVTFSSS